MSNRTKAITTLIGTLAGVAAMAFALIDYRDKRQEEEARVNAYLDDAWDLIGGATGTEYIMSPTADPQKIEQARRLVEQARLLRPRYSRTWRVRAALAFAKGKVATALTDYRVAAKYANSDAEESKALQSACKLLTDSDELSEIPRECARAVKIDPLNANAHYNLGNALRKLGRRGEALASYEQASSIEPKAIYLFNHGVCHVESGAFEKAVDSFRATLARRQELSPVQQISAFHYLGYSLLRSDRWREAVEVLREGLTDHPEHAGMNRVLGHSLLALDELTAATEVFAANTRREPDDPNSWFDLAGAYLTGDDCGSAESALMEVTLGPSVAKQVQSIIELAEACPELLDRLTPVLKQVPSRASRLP